MKYYRTNKTTERVRKKTHIDRWKWIDNDGKGRTYSEISSPNSGYRKCLENDVSLEDSYHGKQSRGELPPEDIIMAELDRLEDQRCKS